MKQGDLAKVGEQAIAAIERQERLDGLADRLQGLVRGALAAAGPAQRSVKNFLHGTWLGHPLHVVLTDVPVGAWTAALVMDLLDDGRRPSRQATGADTAVAVGIAGAVMAAAPGLADWHHTSGVARRSGLVHGLLNTAALALYTGSLLMRRRGRRTAGRGLSGLGYVLVMASAYIGGHLVYRLRMGVDHSTDGAGPTEFVPVLRVDELAEGQPRRVLVDGRPVVIVRRGARVAALAEVCSHLGGPLAEGRVDGETITCPWHGSRFSLDDGSVVEGPATMPQPLYEARVHQGRIEIRRATPVPRAA